MDPLLLRKGKGGGLESEGPEPERPLPVGGILHRRRQQEGWKSDRLGPPLGCRGSTDRLDY
jgi:hypothetical protein